MEGSTRGRKGDVDALAATILLRTALEMMDARDAGVQNGATDPEASHG